MGRDNVSSDYCTFCHTCGDKHFYTVMMPDDQLFVCKDCHGSFEIELEDTTEDTELRPARRCEFCKSKNLEVHYRCQCELTEAPLLISPIN